MSFLDQIASPAMIIIGELIQGQVPNDDEAEFCRNECNTMIDEWNAEGDIVYTIGDTTYLLTNGVGTYPIGPGADAPFDVARPTMIEAANVIVTGTTQNPVHCPMEVVDSVRWAAIEEKGRRATRPLVIYYDFSAPVAKISVWPIPSANCQIELFNWQANVPAIFPQDPVAFPPKATEVQEALNKLLAAQAMVSGAFLAPGQIFNLIAGQQVYSIGPGAADFNTVRPLLVQSANALIPGPVRFALKITEYDEWAAIQERGAQGVRPTNLWCDYAYPAANLNLWPIPSNAASLELFTWGQLAQFATINTTVSLPPAYLQAIKYGLAARIAGSFAAIISPQDAAVAIESRQKIAALNARAIRPPAPPPVAIAPPQAPAQAQVQQQ